MKKESFTSFMKQVAVDLQQSGNLGTAHVVGIRCLRIFARCVRFTIVLSIFGKRLMCRICFAPYIQVRGRTVVGHWMRRI